MRRLAVLADIHGNSLALEAVMADMASRHVDGVVNLGDCVSGPLWPAETMTILRRASWPMVRGNHDRSVALSPRVGLGRSDAFAFDHLSEDDRHWLGDLPTILRLDHDIVAIHACPDDDAAYLIEDQVEGVLQRSSPSTIASRLGSLKASIVLTGHSHQASILRLPDGRWVLNPGSVGCPAYEDESTSPPHVSEAGSPSARYAIMDLSAGTPSVALLSIPYPHEQAAQRADDAGRPDWAQALRTGFASGATA